MKKRKVPKNQQCAVCRKSTTFTTKLASFTKEFSYLHTQNTNPSKITRKLKTRKKFEEPEKMLETENKGVEHYELRNQIAHTGVKTHFLSRNSLDFDISKM